MQRGSTAYIHMQLLQRPVNVCQCGTKGHGLVWIRKQNDPPAPAAKPAPTPLVLITPPHERSLFINERAHWKLELQLLDRERIQYAPLAGGHVCTKGSFCGTAVSRITTKSFALSDPTLRLSDALSAGTLQRTYLCRSSSEAKGFALPASALETRHVRSSWTTQMQAEHLWITFNAISAYFMSRT